MTDNLQIAYSDTNVLWLAGNGWLVGWSVGQSVSRWVGGSVGRLVSQYITLYLLTQKMSGRTLTG